MRGNVLIGQSGGPTAVINASVAGLLEGLTNAGIGDTYYGMHFGIEGFLEDRLIDLSRLGEADRRLLRDTPSSALGSCRYKLADSDLPRVLEKLKARQIRWLFLIGGNDTMDTIHRIEKFARQEGYDLKGLGIPKTVDNDLYGTDHTPGYGSAARYVALSVLQSGQLARDMQRVDPFVVHQTVGREAGWLAAASALAKHEEADAPHLIYFPEVPMVREKLLADVQEQVKRHGYCSIVCGEGVLWEDGRPVSSSEKKDQFKNLEFGAMGGGSAAMMIHRFIADQTGFRGEFQITESLSMCADDRVSMVDREEAFRCGLEAAGFAGEGKSGVMVAMNRLSQDPYRIDFRGVLLEEVAIKAKPMPREFINREGNGVTSQFLDYVKPLVGTLPEYKRLW